MSNTTPASSDSKTPMTPSSTATPGSSNIIPITIPSPPAALPIHQFEKGEDTHIPRRSGAIHNGADDISALFAQEAEKLAAEIKRTYESRLEGERRVFEERLANERIRRRSLEARVAELERKLARMVCS
ncbi:hypothetical protein NP233_g5820 [Leucocoprinus birnbaumii]|uniref:Uncharacterized protein n=1 Tax=Leucocoprinus birnbaumii TaxID=56174 RepID=A0AAD5VSH0_9AGAR|nr:hypothetical protein NP233_g5820 [Leucocoprinus birnbaumii]